MKKSVLLTLTPPKLTKQLREQAEKDIPVIDNAWGRRKEYKYNSYIKAKIEKGYLILSVFKTEFVRSGSKYPMYIVYFDRKKGEYLSLETETGKWRTAMLENLDAGLSCYNFKHYISEKDAEKIKKYLKIGEGDFYSICQYQSSLRTKRLDRQYKLCRSFDGYLNAVSSKGRTIERKNIIVLLDGCTNCRDQLLLLLLAETGFRIGELLGVRYVEDIDYQGCRIRVEPRVDNENKVRAKYEEDRWAKVSKDTFDILLFY